MKIKLIAGLVVLALVATATGAVLARENFGMQPSEGVGSPMMAHQWSKGPGGCMNQLTEEQRQEMHQQMQEFRQQLAEQYGVDLADEERQEMHQQMQEFRQQLFAQYNIICPSGPQFVDEDGVGICDNLGPHMRGFRGEPGF
jgi:hypothetical protein